MALELHSTNNVLISIIVPIYNMERLMKRCIDSILAQTFKNFELLLIDDGSKDTSWAISKEYERKDNRVRALHKNNGGLSSARNFGLAHAKGTYSIFADPDDYVDPFGLDKLYETAEKEQAEITICDLYREDEYSRHYMKQKPTSLDPQTVLNELFYNIGGFTVNKLIKTEVYQKYNITYPQGIYGCEDQYTLAKMLLQPLKIAYVPVAFYHYMYYSNLTNTQSKRYDLATFEQDKKILKMFSKLLEGNEAQKFAIENKTEAMFARAFWFGNKVFSSEKFKELFGNYKSPPFWCRTRNLYIQLCMDLACNGYYQFAHKLLLSGLSIKRSFKILKYKTL